MVAVLGIDAAWTAGQPSGVALAVAEAGRWRLAGLAASYRDFAAIADLDGGETTDETRHVADAALLLHAARSLAGAPVDLVAIDMPIARTPIVRRRPADDAVSCAYGRYKCGTHSPNAERPGAIGEALHRGFARLGYRLCTEAIAVPGLIEVYPHPTLVELAGAAERLPYKVGRSRTYWKEAALPERRARLREQWRTIVALLDERIAGTAAALPPPGDAAIGRELKAYEDRIDAIVCAWAGISALEGRAVPHGDTDAAIWIPRRATDPAG